MKSRQGNNMFLYIVMIIAVVAILWRAMGPTTVTSQTSLQQVAQDIKDGKIDTITVSGNELTIKYVSGQTEKTQKEAESTLVQQLQAYGITEEQLNSKVKVLAESPFDPSTALNIGLTLLAIGALGAMAYLIIRQFQGVNNQAMSFGKSRARMFSGDRPTITFDDVAGVEESKEELQEVVEFLKEPQKFVTLGARIPKGVLLVGSPGTGKTLMAKAVAGEAGVPFFNISGSEFVEMFVGVGASRVRDLFDQARRHSPCIIFIDEIDAVGRYRGAGLGGSHDEREQTLNQILVEMDGFDTDTNIIIIAATNRPDILDPALLRPGRFDRRVVLDQPDIRGREAIFRVHTRGKPVDPSVDLHELAAATPGFVGADIENAVNEAAILAARRNKKRISMSEFQEAIERVIAGPERRSRIISDQERRVFAYHEAGHAVVAHMLPKCDPVRKVSIVARGMAGGYTITMPVEDRYVILRSKLEDDMAYGLGGRAAEQIIFGEASTGAANDLEQITKMARAMVMRYGMSEKLGPLVYGKKEELVFLGKEIGEQRDYSEAMAQAIDEEVQSLVHRAFERAKAVITDHREQLDRVVKTLLERETLQADEFVAVFEGRPLPERRSGKEGLTPNDALIKPSPATI